jgi:hypothetical protein
MKKGIFLLTSILLSISFSFHAFAQWPGNFYAFILKDASGNIITPGNKDYKMIAIDDTAMDVVVGIKICKDDTVWRFYEGGNHYMGSTQKLKIVKDVNGKNPEDMIIEFPPSFSKGKEQYYRNLYAGELKFKKSTLVIKLPQTDEQWDNLKELKLCEDGINFTSYYDVSSYQNK